jgi:hypothetical protein
MQQVRRNWVGQIAHEEVQQQSNGGGTAVSPTVCACTKDLESSRLPTSNGDFPAAASPAGVTLCLLMNLTATHAVRELICTLPFHPRLS